MPDYAKRIAFIDCRVQGITNGNIGFVRYWKEGGHYCVAICLQNIWEQDVSVCKVILEKASGEEICLTEIPVWKGKGEGSCLLHKEDCRDTDAIRLRFEWARGKVGFCRMIFQRQEELQEPVKEDKWVQMQSKYPCFHPFTEQGCFVILQKEEWDLLPACCRKLRENGFCNASYEKSRHMIVGEYDIGGRKQFYLGFPGFYGEEEQQNAAEAGFIGYEFSGAAGYYLFPLGESI